MSRDSVKVVALGGGHGLAATLKSLSALACETTAIVTVADNGGSSGRLRQEFGVLPPGDLRMAFAALCPNDVSGQHMAELLQYRFTGESDLAGHPVGNIILTALWQLEDDKVAALARAARLLGVQGTVLPMASIPLDIKANVQHVDGTMHEIRGQAQVATTAGTIQDVELIPNNPPACVEAIEAVNSADWIILGPGSWYTSVIPALLVPELRKAIASSQARKVVILNLVDQPGETEGLGPVEHLSVLSRFARDVRADTVLIDASHEPFIDEITHRAAALGASVVLADVHDRVNPSTHDTERLSRMLGEVLTRVP